MSHLIPLLQSKDCAPINRASSGFGRRPSCTGFTDVYTKPLSVTVRTTHPPSAPDEINNGAASLEGCPSNKRLFHCLLSDVSNHVIGLIIAKSETNRLFKINGSGGNTEQIKNIVVTRSKCKLVIYDLFLDLYVS